MTEPVDIDAIALEADDTEPFRFRRGDTEFTWPTMLQLDWRDQHEILLGTDTEAKLRILLGDQYDAFTATPFATGRLIKLFDLWYESQGTTKGESAASSSSSGSTGRPSKPTSSATTPSP